MARNKNKDIEWGEPEDVVGDIFVFDEIGDALIGEVIEFGDGDYGEYAIIREDNGDEWQTPSNLIMKRIVGMLEEGDIVRIVYTGEEETKNGNMMKLFDLQRPK
jgi:hypothetical protein